MHEPNGVLLQRLLRWAPGEGGGGPRDCAGQGLNPWSPCVHSHICSWVLLFFSRFPRDPKGIHGIHGSLNLLRPLHQRLVFCSACSLLCVQAILACNDWHRLLRCPKAQVHGRYHHLFPELRVREPRREQMHTTYSRPFKNSKNRSPTMTRSLCLKSTVARHIKSRPYAG